jgi:DNA end-binding protein Ku
MADTKGMARTSTRSLWKGAITFGLVHIPIGLYSATEESDVDFDWLDRRTMDPVGYKRINKRTGKEIGKEDVVKGIAHGKGQLRRAVFRGNRGRLSAHDADHRDRGFRRRRRGALRVPGKTLLHGPINKGEKVYALLREALRETGKAGLARVVIHAKQHLAVVLPCGPALVLNLLRWGGEIRSWDDLPLPAGGKAGIKDAELKMAKTLIDDMSGQWSATEFRDNFHDAIMKLVERKAKAGDTTTVEPLEDAPEKPGAEVIDLTELLRRSLRAVRRLPRRPRVAPGPVPAPRAARARQRRSTQRRPRLRASEAPASPPAPERPRPKRRPPGRQPRAPAAPPDDETPWKRRSPWPPPCSPCSGSLPWAGCSPGAIAACTCAGPRRTSSCGTCGATRHGCAHNGWPLSSMARPRRPQRHWTMPARSGCAGFRSSRATCPN